MCMCIFACMPRDASIQERVGQHTHQVRLRNDVSMPVPDAVPSSWSARTWQALRQKLARSRHRATSSASAGGAQKWASLCMLDALLAELMELATEPQFIYSHHWRPGDLLIWDNRCAIHRRDGFDGSQRRVMHRTQIKGRAPR